MITREERCNLGVEPIPQFKQKFENVAESDANIFQSSLVPIQLITKGLE